MTASVLVGHGVGKATCWRCYGKTPNASSADCRATMPRVIRHAFIPVRSGAEHPTLESINRLAHEYELRDSLDCCVGVAAAGSRARTRADDAGGRVHRRRAPRSPHRRADGDRSISTTRRLADCRTWPAPRTWTHSQGHQAGQRARGLRDRATSGSPGLASPLACRASARRPNLPRSLPARLLTWRRSRRGG